MKGIETPACGGAGLKCKRSDHCPAMKGIETLLAPPPCGGGRSRSDHCPAMKGIETRPPHGERGGAGGKRPLPRNEGD